jgi:hypothetical protein
LADFVGPRPASLIESAQQRLGLIFPASYLEFLRQLGAGSLGSFEVYGVIGPNFEHSSVPDAIWMTLRARRQFGLSKSFVIVGFDGGVAYPAIATGLGSPEHEPPVMLWDPAYRREPEECEVLAESFGAYFLAGIRREIGTP